MKLPAPPKFLEVLEVCGLFTQVSVQLNIGWGKDAGFWP